MLKQDIKSFDYSYMLFVYITLHPTDFTSVNIHNYNYLWQQRLYDHYWLM